MHSGLSRWSAIAGLLLAIVNNLSRRAWWAYRRGGQAAPAPRVAVVQQRARETRPYAPRLTPDWRGLAGQALPVRATGLAILQPDALLPVVWIDARQRPDVRDLPRVLRLEARRPADALSATQWLYDGATHSVLLAITFVEPALSTWALRFDLRADRRWLEQVASAGQMTILPEPPPHPHGECIVVWRDTPAHAIRLPLDTGAQLRAILELAA